MDDLQIGPDGFLLKVSWTASQLKQHQESLQAGGILLVTGHFFVNVVIIEPEFLFQDFYYCSDPRVKAGWKGEKSPEGKYKIKCRDTVQSLSVREHLLACGLQNGEVRYQRGVHK